MSNFYCVLDTCAGVFGDPLACDSDAVAKRLFEFGLSDPSLPDYIRTDSVLYRVAEFNRETGEIKPCVPLVVARGCNVVVAVSKDGGSDA